MKLSEIERAIVARSMVAAGLRASTEGGDGIEVRFLVHDSLDGVFVSWSVARARGSDWSEVEVVLDVVPGRRDRVLWTATAPWSHDEDASDAASGSLIRCPRRSHWWRAGSLSFGDHAVLVPDDTAVTWVAGVAGDTVAWVAVVDEDGEPRRRDVVAGEPFVLVVPSSGEEGEPVSVTVGSADGEVTIEEL